MRSVKKRTLILGFMMMFVLCLSFGHTASAASQTVTKVTCKSYDVGNYQFYTKYTGYTKSGKKVWTYKTGKFTKTELSINYMDETKGIIKNSLVYVHTPNNRIVALNKNTGKMKWATAKNTIGAFTDYCFDSSGNIYICGYYGPDAVKISKTGKVKWSVDTVDPDYWWAYKIRIKSGKVAITYAAQTEKTLYLSKKTGKQIK